MAAGHEALASFATGNRETEDWPALRKNGPICLDKLRQSIYGLDMAKKTVSDSIAKQQCKRYLEGLGYSQVSSAKGHSCDLLGRKDGELYMFEVKYSTRNSGSEFFGTVMFTELFQAVNNKENYFFLVCRGLESDLENWFYRLFSVQEFLDYCTLTTPIGHYRLKFDENRSPEKARVGKRGVAISEAMILDIWKKYREWKPEQQ